LVEFDKRADDEKELSEVYGAWLQSVRVRQQAALHGIIQSLVWILFIVLVVLIVNQLINHFFSDLPSHHKRLLHLRVVLRFAAQAVGLLAIVLVVFGRPGQISTIVGLAGAGLTVALKDFIVAFFGWFVLMGRNGLRVGDWVEINGVGGEVVDIGLLRTVLLETGNWADSGHPTGRKVTFVNSFAIEGHFFNFTTSGQWLWDELEVAIPSGENPYLMVEQIQKIVLAETGSHFSALPAIDIRPSGSGVAVMVRYITRAHERYEVRSRLYQAIVELLHRKHVPPPSKSLAAGDGR
jgi:small-conductance mechanosensitive channel